MYFVLILCGGAFVISLAALASWLGQGCGATLIESHNDEGLVYDDDQWHRLLVLRDGRTAQMFLDSVWIGDSLWLH